MLIWLFKVNLFVIKLILVDRNVVGWVSKNVLCYYYDIGWVVDDNLMYKIYFMFLLDC